jgi:hypothetical protein
MKLSAKQVKNYLGKLGVSIIVGDHIDLRTMLPLNIASRYDAIQSKIAGEEYILLFPKSENITPDDIALHNAAVGKALLACPIFALPRLDKEFASSLKAKKSRTWSPPVRYSSLPALYWNLTERMPMTKNRLAHISHLGPRLSSLTVFYMTNYLEPYNFQLFDHDLKSPL